MITGGFTWADGSPVGYYNWNDNEPSDIDQVNGENCIEMYIHNGKWNDIKCDNLNGYVCKRRKSMFRDKNILNFESSKKCLHILFVKN